MPAPNAQSSSARSGGKLFYSVRNQADDSAEIMIYDEIGGPSWWDDSVDAKSFVRDLGQLDVSNISLRINSPGGSVSDGAAIFNAIQRHPATVTSYVDGFAASAAATVAIAADKVVMAPNAMMMIHEAWDIVGGNAADMHAHADFLEKINGTIASAYATKTGQPLANVAKAMSDETWFTADEAVEFGLADEVSGEDQGSSTFAHFDEHVLNRYRHAVINRFHRAPRQLVEQLRSARPLFAPESSTDVVCTDRSVTGDDRKLIAQVNQMLFS